MSLEQLVLLADALRPHTRAKIVDYPALAAVAGATAARLHGVPLHVSVEDAARTASRLILKLQPLSSHNETFARLVSDTMRELALARDIN
ncbi:Uncharacterised protein [Corynebacterium renale]|uniref:TetR family transcriptional regulator n=1 Tax=Corynebacterium renale TaxID=1724 RepID=UPI000DA3A069|nr:TetR family transcriptional regulator [Corynebacterium renale]SQG63655.1 Uncharacterised protein [Corynebacterium renale]STD01400.1 Uncharacterised protein [Corynebacterium renale]